MIRQTPPLRNDPTTENVRRAFQYEKPILTVPEPVSPPSSERPSVQIPLGRIAAGLALMSVLGVAAYSLWDACFRYSAFGVVTARMIHVTPAVEGTIAEVTIEEGDFVREGQVVAKLHNLRLEHQLARVRDELRVAAAELNAQQARLALEADMRRVEGELATAEFHDARGKQVADQTEYEKLKNELDRARQLAERGAINESDLESAVISEKGQRAKLSSSGDSASVLRQRASLAADLARLDETQLEPTFERVEGLKAEIARLETELAQTEIRAPSSGVVIKQHRFPGEQTRPHQALFTLDVAGSMQAEIYVPQEMSNSLKPGDVVNVQVAPYWDWMPCKVSRVGTRHVPMPENLQRHYPPKSILLPVYLEPRLEFLEGRTIRPGATVKLARSWFGS